MTPDSGHPHTGYDPQNKQANIINPIIHIYPIPISWQSLFFQNLTSSIHENQESTRFLPKHFHLVQIHAHKYIFQSLATSNVAREHTHMARCRKTDSISCHITLHITHNINNQLNTIIHACKLSSYSFILYFLVPISQPHRLIIIIKSNQTWKYLFKRPMYTYIQATFHFILTLDSKIVFSFPSLQFIVIRRLISTTWTTWSTGITVKLACNRICDTRQLLLLLLEISCLCRSGVGV